LISAYYDDILTIFHPIQGQGTLLFDVRPLNDWHYTAMASLGRALQILGLVLPPLSIVLQLQSAITAGQMLLMLVAAVSAFWLGRIVEGYARH
jgi:F0F1-type ATP synthase membrane subunit a